MQAHPQSTPAARNQSTPHMSAHAAAGLHGGSQPQLKTPLKPCAPTQPCIPSASISVADHAGLAHDAGNLLGALQLYCNLLSLPGVLGPEHRHYATELSLISERSSELIRRLLALPAPGSPEAVDSHSGRPSSSTASAQAANQRGELPQQDELPAHDGRSASNPVHAYTLRRLAPVLQRIAAGTADVTVSCPSSLPTLNVPAEIIERITINLVRNAAQAFQEVQTKHAQRAGTQPGSPGAMPFLRRGEIRVALATAASRLRLTVEDNGPGLPQALVDEFLRPSPLPPGAEHGLGHCIVHELASGSGGRISIRVRPGRGTLFTIAWPIPNTRSLLDVPLNLPQNMAQRGFSTC